MKKHLSERLTFCYQSHTICNHDIKQKKNINFKIICGTESQIPKIENKKCTTNVLIIDPEVCNKKVSTFYYI